MNIFDIIIIFVISLCLIRGLFRGIVREVSSIVGVVAGFYGAYNYFPMISPYFTKWISNPGYRNLLSFFILFCLILIAISLIATLIRYFLNIVFLGWVDRLCGMIFGGAKGILIVSVLFIILTTFLPRNSSILVNSRLSSSVAKVSEAIVLFIDNNMKKELRTKLKGMEKHWKQQTKTKQRQV